MTDELLLGRMPFQAGPDSFPLSTDTMVLGDFVRLPKNARVVDLGSGSGALGLLLCGRYPDCTVTGLELHRPSHEAALRNIARNRLSERMESRLGDLRQVRSLLPPGSCHCVVYNPPYFSAGASSRSPAGPQARKELACTLEDVFSAAAWLLRFGGSLYLVHRPERLVDLLTLGRAQGLEPKELQTVCHRPGHAPSLVLLRCRRGAKPGLAMLPELTLYGPDGAPTPAFRRIYHMDEGGLS